MSFEIVWNSDDRCKVAHNNTLREVQVDNDKSRKKLILSVKQDKCLAFKMEA